MNINLDYVKQMRLQAWDAYFECLDLIDHTYEYGSPIEKLRLKAMWEKLDKLAAKSRKYDEIYAVIYDPLYPLHPSGEI